MTTPADYQAMFKNLVEEMGLASLPEEKQLELIGKMGEVLIKRIMVETFDRLGEDGVVEYEKMVDGGASEDEVKRYFESKIPDYSAMIEKIVADFKEEMKKDVAI